MNLVVEVEVETWERSREKHSGLSVMSRVACGASWGPRARAQQVARDAQRHSCAPHPCTCPQLCPSPPGALVTTPAALCARAVLQAVAWRQKAGNPKVPKGIETLVQGLTRALRCLLLVLRTQLRIEPEPGLEARAPRGCSGLVVMHRPYPPWA